MNVFRLFIFVQIVFFCFVAEVNAASLMSSTSTPIAQKGVLDLRSQNFNQNIRLDGEWLFNWHKLLTPAQAKTARGVAVRFPQLWTQYLLNGREFPAFGYATYTLTVLLPANRGPFKITLPDVYSSYKLYVNGKLEAVNGQVGTSPNNFVPYWEVKDIDLPLTDTLNLVLQISNFAHSKGGICESIVIGKEDAIELGRKRSDGIDLLLTGCLFMGGLFFLGLYLFGNRDKAILLFSLFAIVYSYRIIGSDNYVLHGLVPHMNWFITIRLEYISLFIGIGLFSLYSRYLYRQDQHTVVTVAVSAICAAFALATLLLPPIYFTQLINPFLIVTVFCLVYVPYLYIKAYRKNRPGAIYSLASAIVIMSVFALSLLHYWHITPSLQMLSFVGYVSFFFLQSLVLSYRVSFVLKKANEQAAEGLKAKADFLSTMSHEIRTPLNSVIGMSHLLLRNNPREDQQENLNAMIFSANNLLNIVNDVLDYSKIEAGMIKFEHIDINMANLAGSVVQSLQNAARDKGLSLKLHIDKELRHYVKGDPTRTSQVITNLVHNAIKFTSLGGINVSVTINDQTETQITLCIEVEDTGIGISKEKQALIFERFTQADSSISRGFGGTGLGLAISKKILELQGSSLMLRSEEGQGSNFYFIQRFEKSIEIAAKPQSGYNEAKDSKPFTGVAILLVDDNPMNVMVAQSFLQRWGAEVDVAVNGQNALEKIDTEKHKLVLMDIQMPVMDGFESSRTMRSRGVAIPIIALTAALPSEIEFQVAENGIDDILVKPFLPDELYSKVYHYVFSSKAH